MCGINGFTFRDEQLIRQMNDRIKHRGPDGDGVFVDGSISLGHRRLSIIDLSERGAQPMFSADKTKVLVFNGEIYNFQSLRDELKKQGYQFHSDTDSEVILYAYEQYGRDCVKHFNGIFAFAIWDQKTQELFLARDQVGVKPLYYYWNPDEDERFVFSSELKSLLVHNLKKKINTEALNIYFHMLYVPAPLTMLENIFKLEPGTWLVYKQGKVEKQKYWHLEEGEFLSREQATQELSKLVHESVRLQMISDRPLGVFLSGGIDSTIITGIAQKISSQPLKTFSVAYDITGDKFNADSSLAQKTSKYFGTDHHEYVVTGKYACENLEDVIYHMDEPVANATQIATYFLSKMTREHVVVTLGGDGGDELFGGYERYLLSRYISIYQSLPPFVKKGALPFLQILQKKYPTLSKFYLEPGVNRYLSFMAQKEKDVSRIVKEQVFSSDAAKNFYSDHYFQDKFTDPELQFMIADISSWLPDESLLRSDKMSMAFGIEQRVPFLDSRLVELSTRIRTKDKIQGKNKKAILKDALKEYIPDYILEQPKRGWFSPTSQWMRTDLKELSQSILRPEYADTSEWIDFSNVAHMFDSHVNQKEYQMNLLWATITFQIWYRHFMK